MVRSVAISAGVGALTALLVFVSLCLLTGCIPGGLTFQGPGIAVDSSHDPAKVRAGNCVFEGQVIMSEGTRLECGEAPAGQEEADPAGAPAAGADASPAMPPDGASPASADPAAVQLPDAPAAAPSGPASGRPDSAPPPDIDATPPAVGAPEAPAEPVALQPAPPGPTATAGPDAAQVQDPAQAAALAPGDPVSSVPLERQPPPSDPCAGVPGFVYEEITAAEGNKPGLYCDVAGLHVGDGVRVAIADAAAELEICAMLESAESRIPAEARRRLTCLGIRTAQGEAQRVLGAFVWPTLNPVRQGAWTVLCWWANCAGFVDTARHTRLGEWPEAGWEAINSTLPGRNLERARRVSSWLATGELD